MKEICYRNLYADLSEPGQLASDRALNLTSFLVARLAAAFKTKATKEVLVTDCEQVLDSPSRTRA